jgi:prophage tail gpP-like protein/phage tail protein X
MPRNYIVKTGDTIQAVAIRMYGDVSKYPVILHANQQLRQNVPLQSGMVLVIPDLKDALAPIIQKSDDPDLVTIIIDGVRLIHWSDLTIELTIDKFANSFSFSVPWDPDVLLYRSLFRPFTYKLCKIFIGNQLILTGNVINNKPSSAYDSRTLKISGYSSAGILNDCNFPQSAFPLYFDGLTLPEIARSSLEFFNLEFLDSSGDTQPFADITVKPQDKVINFLIDLAKKRGLIFRSTPDGTLELTRASTVKSKFTLQEKETNIIGIECVLDGTLGYSSITGMLGMSAGSSDEENGDLYTETDEFITAAGVSRPFLFELDNIDQGTIVDAVKAKHRRNWSDRINYILTVEGWRTPLNEIWREDTRLQVIYPSAFIYINYEFIIKTVRLITSANERKTELELTLPQAYTNEELITLPWL